MIIAACKPANHRTDWRPVTHVYLLAPFGVKISQRLGLRVAISAPAPSAEIGEQSLFQSLLGVRFGSRQNIAETPDV